MKIHENNGRVRFEETKTDLITLEVVNNTVKAAVDGLMKNHLPAVLKPFADRFDSIDALLKTKTKEEVVVTPVDDKKITPEVQALMLDEKRKREALESKLSNIEAKNKANEDKAEKAERESAISRELSKYTFLNPKAAANAEKLIGLEVRRSEDGQLIAGDNLPIDAFIKDFLTVQNDHFLAGKDTSGTGASKGAKVSTASVGIESIKRDMTPETRETVRAQILAALR